LAARIVNALADEYLEFNLETRVKAATLATEFLETELEQLQVKVEKSETALVEYARKHGIVEAGENSNRENIVLQKLADLNAEMTKVQAELIAHTVRYENSRGADVENFPESLETPAIKQLQARLSELKEKHASLSGRYGPEHIEFAQLERQLLELEAQLAKEKQAALEKVRQDYHLALDHYRSIARALEEQKQLAAKLSEDSIQYNILKREVDSNKQLYDGLLQRLKQAGVSAGLRSSNLHILERASIPGSPSAPRHSRNLLLGALLGLMLGVGLAFGLDYFDDSIKTPDELEQSARLPALGMIPTMRQAGAAHHAALPPSSQDETKPAALPFPQDVGFWEAYRTLRTSLLLSHSDKPPRILLVTSAAPGEGKTTTAINLAISLAQTGARTLLVDLEMRKPEVAGRLRLNDTQGMSLFLSGNSSLSSQIVQTPYDNLFVIPAGPPPPNPAELIGSKRWRKALVLLRDYFQHVVIDSPPVLSVADPLIISRQVDGVVLVVRAGKTPREAVRKARRALDTVGATVLGAIINGVDLKNAEYSYYYRHYYAYEYYSRGRQG